MPYFFSKKIVNVPVVDGKGNPVYGSDGTPKTYRGWMDQMGVGHPESSVTPAQTDNPDIDESMNFHGFVPDAARQADVDALITFVIAQTGLNYGQDPSGRFARISSYNAAVPPAVPVTADEGKLVFNRMGCYSCHYQGDPNNPQERQRRRCRTEPFVGRRASLAPMDRSALCEPAGVRAQIHHAGLPVLGFSARGADFV